MPAPQASRVIGFAGEGQRDELADADVVIEKMAELPAALGGLSAGT